MSRVRSPSPAPTPAPANAAESVQGVQRERDGRVGRQLLTPLPGFSELAVAEPVVDDQERIVVHPRNPWIAAAELFAQSLVARDKPNGRLQFSRLSDCSG